MKILLWSIFLVIMWNWIVGRQKGKKLPKSLEVWEIVCIFAAYVT